MSSLEDATDEWLKNNGKVEPSELEKHSDAWVSSQPPPKQAPPSMPAEEDKPAVEFGGSNLQFATPWKTYDTGIPISGASEKALAQFGSGVDDWRAAYQQIMGKAGREDIDEKRKIDAPLNKGVMGTINNFAGKVLPAVAATAALPIEGAWAPTAAIGAGLLQGAVEPVGTGESRVTNTLAGGAGGALFPFAKWLAGSGDEVLDRSIQMARQMGIPTTIADASSNPLIRNFREFTDKLPILNRANQAAQDAQEKAFTSKIAEAWGRKGGDVTRTQLSQDADDIGKHLQDIFMRNDMPANAPLDTAIDAVKTKFGRTNETIDKALDKAITNLKKNFQVDKNGFVYSNGDDVNQWQMQIGADAQGDTTVQKALRALRNAVLDHYQNNLPQQTSNDLATLRGQYQAAKAMESSVGKASAGVGGRESGKITPDDLSRAVANFYGEVTPWDNLARVGQDVVNRTPKREMSLGELTALPFATALAPITYGANRFINSPGAVDVVNGISRFAKGPLTRGDIPQAMEKVVREGARRTTGPATVQGALGLTHQLTGEPTEEAPFRVEVVGTRADSTPEEIEAADRELALRRLQRGQ